MQNQSDFSKAFFNKMRGICERQIVNTTEKIATNEQQRIKHLEKLLDDAAGAMALLRKDNERQAEQISALVADNVARGEIIERLIGQYGAAGYHAVQNSLNQGQSLLYDAMQVMKQCATDAAIAAIRAEGVEMFAVTIPNLIEPMINEHYLESKAVEFAAQLREGAQK